MRVFARRIDSNLGGSEISISRWLEKPASLSTRWTQASRSIFENPDIMTGKDSTLNVRRPESCARFAAFACDRDRRPMRGVSAQASFDQPASPPSFDHESDESSRASASKELSCRDRRRGPGRPMHDHRCGLSARFIDADCRLPRAGQAKKFGFAGARTASGSVQSLVRSSSVASGAYLATLFIPFLQPESDP